MVEGQPRNSLVKLFQNPSTDLAEEAVLSFFLFIALAAMLFNGVERFVQFWWNIPVTLFQNPFTGLAEVCVCVCVFQFS